MENLKEKQFIGKWLFIMIAIFLILSFLIFISYLLFENKYRDRIYPGIKIANINVGGMKPDDAKNFLSEKTKIIMNRGLEFHYHDFSASLPPVISSVESDLAYEVYAFDIEKTVEQAYDFGRLTNVYLYKEAKNIKTTNSYNNIQNILKALIYSVNIQTHYALNTGAASSFLKDNFFRFETPAKDAKLVYETKGKPETYTFSITEEAFGQILDYAEALEKLKNNLSGLTNGQIVINARIDHPLLYKTDALNIDNKANKIISLAPLTLTAEDKKWKVEKGDLASWLKLERNESNNQGKDIDIGLDTATITVFLSEKISKYYNVEPEEAKFEIKNGKVIEFQASRDGKKLDIDESVSAIKQAILNDGKNEINLIVSEVKSSIKTEEINDLGISELLGTGHSSFAGSPKNRRHNIAVGAAAVNGTLIKPGEEFSLIKTLGEIDADSGYLPELVIKENKTIPEYGGGLCQIGTTVFRGTIEAGLPVTMRRNHSYRVSYYEPAGTDATIYNPWPDYRFLNDSASYILIQSRIIGDDLYFDFWGTGDGRVATHTYPVIYNIVSPGPTKIIETLDLKPGEKKCTESAHAGADAYFDYTITYADGKVDEKRYKSHYVPWKAVCLLGVEKISEKIDETATSSPAKNE